MGDLDKEGKGEERLIQAIRERYDAAFSLAKIPERLKRLWAAMVAKEHGQGGIKLVGEAIGMSPTTIRRGLRELREWETGQSGNLSFGRSPGGGRKRTASIHINARKELEILIEPVASGDSESPLRWTCKSLRQLAEELVQRKIKICPNTVRVLLNEMGYNIQANRKTRRGINHPDRNAQFEYINGQARDFLLARQPVIFIDTKKMKYLDKSTSCNVADDAKNEGWTSIGVNHNTAPFAAYSIRRWWNEMRLPCFPQANRLLIIADADDSNSSRMRSWKMLLQRLSSDYRFDMIVCHFPPGTSKWSKIEHRFFSFGNQYKPFCDLVTIVNLVGNTTASERLPDRNFIDETAYEKEIKASDEELKAIEVQEHDFHGEWNYTISNT